MVLAVASQQQETERTALGSTIVLGGGAGGGFANPDCLESPSHKKKHPRSICRRR